jgi:DNA polymerase IIIc chi subunit
MATVTIHRIAIAKKALDICRIAEELYLAGKRAVVLVTDSKRAAILDDYLWTFAQPSFVPHALWDGATPIEEPVAIVAGELANPNGATALLVADRVADPAAAAAMFAEIHDVDARLAEDEGKAEAWADAGCSVTAGRTATGR